MTSPAEKSWFAIMRYRMVEAQLRDRGIVDERVLGAMLRVPRHEFVAETYRGQAYEDHPLPIGEGQTISQPYIVALMLQALALTPEDKVLEIGTGSGYVTALLAELTKEVISVERHSVLAAGAREILARLGYANVRIAVGDGSLGYPQSAPYDAILGSAAAYELPPALVGQLTDNGRMILPVGSSDGQRLQLVRMRNGEPQVSLREACRFVPLVSDLPKAEA